MFEPSRATISLAIFNRQVLQCQDDAYTLAWYLLGDVALAETAVQAAVESAFQHGAAIHHGDALNKSCRLVIFRVVVEQCQRQLNRPLPLIGETGEQGILEMLRRLPEQERQALILVDILSMGYAEGAEVLRMPVEDFRQRLAWGRRKLAACQAHPAPSLLMQSQGKV